MPRPLHHYVVPLPRFAGEDRSPAAMPLPILRRLRGRIEGVPATPFFLPCEAGEGDHAKHGGGGAQP